MSPNMQEDFDRVPGTVVFDSRKARIGRGLNKMCASFVNEENRAQFVVNPEEYMAKYSLTEEQKQAVRDRDWMRMLELGGNIYFIAKLGGFDKLSVQDINAKMTGVTVEEFKAMLAQGGRNPNG